MTKHGLTVVERYESHVLRGAPNECHLWTGGTTGRTGYGQFWDGSILPSGNKKKVVAHRWGYETFVGPVPDGQHVRHTCDTPLCQNRNHWILGTQQDNMDDRASRGRTARGSRVAQSRLSQVQVDEIRLLHSSQGLSYRTLARLFAVGPTTVGNIVRGETWKP